jgi:hypothetical protein
MDAILCSLSEKRLAMIEQEPDLLEELLEVRFSGTIPGLLDLGRSWDALDVLLSARGRDPVLGDAILARSGRTMRAKAAFGPAQLLSPERVVEVSEALDKLPAGVIRARYPDLKGLTVHGDYGQETASSGDGKYIRQVVREKQENEVAELEARLKKLVALYRRAAKEGQAMMSVVV